MVDVLNENEVSAKELSKKLGDFFDEGIFVLRKVRRVNRYENGQRTNDIAGYAYEVIDGTSYAKFTVKVASTEPVITEEQLEACKDTVFVKIPLEKTLIIPYELKYGRAKVSITAPFIELLKEEA